MSWCTIESDPGVFNALINEIGVKNVQVEEIYSLDSSEQRKEKSHGLIFLFKYRAENDPRPVLDSTETPVYFARQVVSNACATQAVISVLLNSENVNLGPTLSDFKAFTIDFDSESRGLAIGNSEVLREVHNSFARPEPFIHEEARNASDAEEAYHFVAYVPCHGSVYEYVRSDFLSLRCIMRSCYVF
jgi:ubiquitin carboxyl-terminal hydrolase L5